MTRQKRLLMSVLMCSCLSNFAYAADYQLTENTEWSVGSGEGEVQVRGGDSITLSDGITLTAHSDRANPIVTDNYPVYLNSEATQGITITGGTGSRLVLTDNINHGSSFRPAALVNSAGAGTDITISNADLEINNYTAGLEAYGDGGQIIISNNSLAINNANTAIQAAGSGRIDIHSQTVEFFDNAEAINVSESGAVSITAASFAARSFDGYHAAGLIVGGATVPQNYNTLDINAAEITIDGYFEGLKAQKGGTITIDHSGANAGQFRLLNNEYGITTGTYGGAVNILTDGAMYIQGNSSDSVGISAYAPCDAANGVKISGSGAIYLENNKWGIYTGNHDAVYIGSAAGASVLASVQFNNNSSKGIYSMYKNGVNIAYVDELAFAANKRGIDSNANDGVNISNINSFRLAGTTDYGIIGWKEHAVNIDKVAGMSVEANNFGIFGNAGQSVRLTNVDALQFAGNNYGVYTNHTDGVVLANNHELSFTDNLLAMYVDSGGSLNFATGTLSASSGEAVDEQGAGIDQVVGYATGAGSAITLTADTALISALNGEADNATFIAMRGAAIDFTAAGITALRDSGYLAYVDNNVGSSVHFATETGTMTGAFRTDGGTLNLDLGRDTGWTINADSSLTDLKIGDASALAFAATDGFLRLDAVNIYSAAGSGSSISMNINAAAHNQSDRIYVAGQHSGSSAILLNNRAQDINDNVIGTVLVSVNDEQGEFRGGTTEGALYWWKYSLASRDSETYTEGGGNHKDWYLDSYELVDKQPEQPDVPAEPADPPAEPEPPAEVTPDPAPPDVTPDPAPDEQPGITPDLPAEPEPTPPVVTPEPTPDEQPGTTPELPAEPEPTPPVVTPEPTPDEQPGNTPAPEPQPTPDKPVDNQPDAVPGPGMGAGGADSASTTTVDSVVAAGAVNYYAFRENDKLLRRMGELRQNGADAQGAWLRVNGAGMGRQGSFDNRYTHYEIGYDQLYRDDGQGRSFEGFSLSYAEGRSSYQRGSGENHNENISFYRVDQRNTGHYLDLVCRIGFYANSFSVADSMLNKISGRTDSYGISANVEYGRKNSLKHGWYLEPQAQLTIGHISSSQYSTSNGVDVHQGGMNSLVGRAGLNIGKSFGKERRGSIYLKANLLREFLGSYGIDMSTGGTQRSARGSYRDNWFEYGLGFAWQYGKNAHIYADVERSAGSSYYKNWAWNVGLRWTFN